MTNDWIRECFEENQDQLQVLTCSNKNQLKNILMNTAYSILKEEIVNQIIAKDAYLSYWYSIDILKGPFPAGEPAIATDIIYSYFYAREILHKSFPLGEPIIAKDITWSYLYAKNVLHGPFPAAEYLINSRVFWKNKYDAWINKI